jgi:copper chaperone
MPMSEERRSYTVTGMTCQHCVAAVDAEVGALPGVSSVDVDLASGALVVSGSDIDGETVRSAVEEAGYSLAS